MKYIYSLVLLLAILCDSGVSYCQNINSNVAIFKNNIVRITNTQASETGSGFIISDADNELLIVTAKHVVKNAQKVSIEVENNAGLLDGEVINEHNHYDLALVKVRFKRPDQSKMHFVTNIEGGDSVFYMSVNDNKRIFPPDGSGTIIDRDSEYLIMRLKNVQQGDSGTPVFSREGVVGMIFTRSPVQALSIVLIKSIIEEWEGKWQMNQAEKIRTRVIDPHPPDISKEVTTDILNITLNNNECATDLNQCADGNLSTFWSCKAVGWKKIFLTLRPKTSFRFVKIFYPNTSHDELLAGDMYLPQLKKRFSFMKTLMRFKEPESDGDWFVYDLGDYFIADRLEFTMKIKKDVSTDVITELRIFEIKITGPLK